MTYYGDLPKSQQDKPSIKAVYSEISKRNIGNIVKQGFSVTSKADDMQIRRTIDVEPDANFFKGEVDSNKTAGLRPDQVKNKEKLVPKDIKSTFRLSKVLFGKKQRTMELIQKLSKEQKLDGMQRLILDQH